MAASPSTVGIFNRALALLGGEQLSTVEGPWEKSALGILCVNNFPGVLDMALEAHDWSFARAREDLAEKPETRPRRNYSRRYALPSACLRPLELTGGWPFILEGSDLLTDAAPAELHYIQRVEDPRVWPPAFQTALAWGLAAVLAAAKTNDPRIQQACFERYNVTLLEAMARDNNMQQPADEPTEWERARFGQPGASRWRRDG